jgi:hypothetical protein
MTMYQLADALKAGLFNVGCEGVTEDIRFAVHNLTAHERGKLAALLGVYGYTSIPDVTAATGFTPEQVSALQR